MIERRYDVVAAVASGRESDDEKPPHTAGCLPLQSPQLSSSSTLAATLPAPLSRSTAAWLEDFFVTDPTDQLLGSFTCAYAAHILIQGKIFIVRGKRHGARVFFFSNILSMITTRVLNLSDIATVRKINRIGTISALEMIRREDGKSFVFCSFLYRENAFQCMHDAWLTALARFGEEGRGGRGRGREKEEKEEERGIELKDMTGWKARSEKRSKAGGKDVGVVVTELDDGGSRGRRGTRGGGGGGSGGGGSGGNKLNKLKRSNSAPELTLLDHESIMDTTTHADAHFILRREMEDTPPHVFYTLYDAKGSLLAAHLEENCNATDLKMSPMTPFGRGGDNDISERFISYRTPTMYAFPNMPKFCTVNDTQRYITPRSDDDDDAEEEEEECDEGDGVDGKEKVWVMHSSAAMRGAPYADAFTVETRLRVSGISSRDSAVEVSCKVAWKKPVNSLLRGLILKGAKEQLRRSYAKLMDLAAARISERSVSDRIRVIRSAICRHSRSPSVGSGMQQEQAALVAPGGRRGRDETAATAVQADSMAMDRVQVEDTSSTIDRRRLSSSPPDISWFVPMVIIFLTFVLFFYLGVSRWIFFASSTSSSSSPPLLPQDSVPVAYPVLCPPLHRETCSVGLDGDGVLTPEVVRAALNRLLEDDCLIQILASLINTKNNTDATRGNER